jgi:hypothetical protein
MRHKKTTLDLRSMGATTYSMAHMCICATEFQFKISRGGPYHNFVAHWTICATKLEIFVAHTNIMCHRNVMILWRINDSCA